MSKVLYAIENDEMSNFIDQYNLDPNFSLSKNEYCNYNTYYFNHSSSNPSNWEWSLDSNVISYNSSDSDNGRKE